jgi:hypothetical protein
MQRAIIECKECNCWCLHELTPNGNSIDVHCTHCSFSYNMEVPKKQIPQIINTLQAFHITLLNVYPQLRDIHIPGDFVVLPRAD